MTAAVAIRPPARWRCRMAAAMAGAVVAAACGPGSPSGPSAFDPLRPLGLILLAQRVTLSSNQFDLAWSGSAPAYRVVIGTTTSGSEAGTFDVAGPSYTFVAPRTANTYYLRVIGTDGTRSSEPSLQQLTLTAIDIRHVIDALYFNGGPLSEFRAIQPGTVQAAVWPDGTRLRVIVSREGGESLRAFAQFAIDDYASLVQGAVTGTTEIVDDDMHSLANAQLPPLTIAVRILPGSCGPTAAACADIGPAPVGRNASIVTINRAGTNPSQGTVTHEFGHAYGLRHLLRPFGNQSFAFVMSPVSNGSALSEIERTAILAARAGGIRAGTTREQALAADLVLPYFAGSTVASSSGLDLGICGTPGGLLHAPR